MNGDRYEWLVTNKFASWRQACFEDDEPVSLVQDRERCLWQDRNFKALRQTGCPVVDQHPKHSPDMNAIEGWWKLLRQRLEVTEPEEFEGRAAFLVRLGRAATWLNSNRWAQVLQLFTHHSQAIKQPDKNAEAERTAETARQKCRNRAHYKNKQQNGAV